MQPNTGDTSLASHERFLITFLAEYFFRTIRCVGGPDRQGACIARAFVQNTLVALGQLLAVPREKASPGKRHMQLLMKFEFLRNDFVLFAALDACQYFLADVIGDIVDAVGQFNFRTEVLILFLHGIEPSPPPRQNLFFGEREIVLGQRLVVGEA